MIRNKKAEVPIVILVIGVFFLCVLTFINFNFIGNPFKSGYGDKYYGLDKIGQIEMCLSSIEQYYFYSNYCKGDSKKAKELISEINKELFLGGIINIEEEEKSFLIYCNLDGLKIKYPLN